MWLIWQVTETNGKKWLTKSLDSTTHDSCEKEEEEEKKKKNENENENMNKNKKQ